MNCNLMQKGRGVRAIAVPAPSLAPGQQHPTVLPVALLLFPLFPLLVSIIIPEGLHPMHPSDRSHRHVALQRIFFCLQERGPEASFEHSLYRAVPHLPSVAPLSSFRLRLACPLRLLVFSSSRRQYQQLKVSGLVTLVQHACNHVNISNPFALPQQNVA
jgi:hypothetical protein